MSVISLEPAPGPPSRTTIDIRRGARFDVARLARGAGMVLLVTDRNVAATPWPGDVEQALLDAGASTFRTVLSPGERHKTVAAAETIWARWTAAGAGRDAIVVAVGGGVTTDIAGLAAACYVRGVPWIAVPTSVLAMADAAIGGKTGVNTPAGKNLVGSVHHPRGVLADLETLSTLPPDVYAEGWAEVIKAGVIGDRALLEDVERHPRAILGRDLDTLERLLSSSVRVKAAVVSADEREAGRREILNFGHTVAHALESASDHVVRHGAAVAIGMVAEARLGARMGRLADELSGRIAAACAGLGLPTRLPAGVPRASLRAAFSVDKKRRDGRLRVSLPLAVGEHAADPSVFVTEADLLGCLEEA